jgi:hypothetical protein
MARRSRLCLLLVLELVLVLAGVVAKPERVGLSRAFSRKGGRFFSFNVRITRTSFEHGMAPLLHRLKEQPGLGRFRLGTKNRLLCNNNSYIISQFKD